MPQTPPTLPQKHPSVFHTATLRYETLQQARSPMCWPTEEVRMSGRTRAACGLVVASLFAASTAAGQGARVQFGVGGSLTVPLGDFHADANGDGFKAGWQGLALLDVRPRKSPVGVRVDFDYGENSSNDKFNADLSGVVGARSEEHTSELQSRLHL